MIHRLHDPEAVAHEGALELIRGAQRASEDGRRFHVALAGGSTPRRMLERLSEDPLRDCVRWQNVFFFFGDERMVAPSDADSNYRMASEALFSKLDLRPDQVQRIHGEHADPDASARNYERTLREALSENAHSAGSGLDLVYLGMGEDGHTASLFPGTDALLESRRWVVANEVPQLGATRITLTFPALAHARRVVFMVCGTSKAARLAEVAAATMGEESLPAARVNPTSGELVWLVDEEAASALGSDSVAE